MAAGTTVQASPEIMARFLKQIELLVGNLSLMFSRAVEPACTEVINKITTSAYEIQLVLYVRILAECAATLGKYEMTLKLIDGGRNMPSTKWQ